MTPAGAGELCLGALSNGKTCDARSIACSSGAWEAGQLLCHMLRMGTSGQLQPTSVDLEGEVDV